MQHRKEIKKPLTSQAIKLILRKLEANKADHVEMIKNSIERRWMTVFPLNEKENNKRSSRVYIEPNRDSEINERRNLLSKQFKELTN